MPLLSWLAGFVGVLAGILAGLVAVLLGAGALATLVIGLSVEARYPAQGRRVAVAGGHLAMIEAGPVEGARATVVLLHGASANASDPMEGFGRKLAESGFRVLAVDRPGYGASDRLAGADAASPAFQAAAIGEALEGLGVGPAIIVGHSWAGALAARMALDRPERVAGLVLVAPVVLPSPERPMPWWARAALTPPVAWVLSRTLAAPLGLYYLRSAARAVFTPQVASDGYVERSRAPLVLRPASALANVQDLIGLPAALREQAPRYAGIAAPTVIVAGEADGAVLTTRQARPLAERIPGAKLVVLPGIGHMVHYAAADALVAEIAALSDRIAPPAP